MTADERTGYDLRQGAEMIAERAVHPNRLLVNAVTFHFQVPHEPGPHSRYDTQATGSVDRYGHVSLDIPASRRSMPPRHLDEYRAEIAEALVEVGLVEWRAIGSGDTELYATQALLRHLAPALAALPSDWREWPLSG